MTSETEESRLYELRDEAEWSLKMGRRISIVPCKELINLVNEVIFRRLKEEEMLMDEEYGEVAG
jgi:hypothetical protein